MRDDALRPRVAIVDDEPDIVLYLRAALEDNGYRVVPTSDATTALAFLARERPDVICLDLVMPGVSGVALHSELRRHPALTRCPVVILSGLSEGVVEAVARAVPEAAPSRVLANLVSNAVDACLVGDTPHPEIVVGVYEADGTIVCEVADKGCGMDYEVKQKAFTSFFTTKAQGGTGLGLLLTRKLVQQRGGRIELASEPGRGTRFRLVFPRDRLPTQEEQDD